MDMHKIAHDLCETTRHCHFPLIAGLIGYIRITPKKRIKEIIGDLGEVPGDNILPSEILISISSRRVL